MKWQTLALSFLASTGLASPIAADAKPGAVYALRLVSNYKSLDGKYLGVDGSLVGIYKRASALRFTPTTNPKTGLVELHTFPHGAVDQALALVGSESQGLLDLTNVANPASASFPKGTKCDWTSFHLADTKAGATVTYAAESGGWVAFPAASGAGEWSVKWKDPEAITIQNFMPVKVVYEPVDRDIDFVPITSS